MTRALLLALILSGLVSVAYRAATDPDVLPVLLALGAASVALGAIQLLRRSCLCGHRWAREGRSGGRLYYRCVECGAERVESLAGGVR